MKKLTMSKVLTIFQKHYPSIVTEFIEQYCTEADRPGTDKDFFFGYGSFKWAMHQIHQIDNPQLKNIFYGILCEFSLNLLSEHDIQFRILKSFHLRQYREQLKNLPETPDILKFETFKAGNYSFIFNTTKNNLTSKIFRTLYTDAVIAVNTELKEASITLRFNSKINQLEGFKHYLIQKCTEQEPGWLIHGENNNRIVNFGIPAKTPSQLKPQFFQEIITNYFNK